MVTQLVSTKGFFFHKEFNLFAVAFEDPDGKNPPEVIGGWTRSIRQIMDKNRCKAHLLVHVHERYGFCDSTVLQVRERHHFICLHIPSDRVTRDMRGE